MHILVTGGSGFVGRHLLTVLRERFADATLSAPAADVTDPGAIGDAIASAAPDAVVHLAAIAAPAQAGRDPAAAWRVNLHGTLHVAEAVRARPGCRLLFVSSGDAYGGSFRSGVPLDESAPLAPLNPYAATKAAADLALGAAAASGLHVIRLRPFNHTGPGQSAEFVVPAFARQVARIEAGLQPAALAVGALAPVRDMLDVRDVCAAYAAALAHVDTLPPGCILNVASGIGRSIGGVLDELLQLAGLSAARQTDPARLRPTDVAAALGDASAARAALDWAPRIPWTQTLSDVLDDWRARVRHSDRIG